MTFHRHFVQRPDFETAVITHDVAAANQNYDSLILPISPAYARFARTRFSHWVHGAHHRWAGRRIPASVHDFIDDFKPDAIFTVGGAWSSMARLAERVALNRKLPLIGSFNDWWNYNQIYHSAFEPSLSKQFVEFYQRCDLAICTSEGMQSALGNHPNSVVLYPTGAEFEPTDSFTAPKSDQMLRVGFGGNLGDWYGTMLESLVTACRRSSTSDFQFHIFGSRPSWSDEFQELASTERIFHGQVDFETLTREMRSCDILLLPMGFARESRQVESTSFKTKFLDYLTFEKPILVWGPDYCSAVQTASEFDSAEICIDEDASSAAATLSSLRSNPERQSQLVVNARRMYLDRFHPNRLHAELVSRIEKLL